MNCRFLSCAASLMVVVAASTLEAQVVPPTPTTPPSPLVTPQQDEAQRVTATGCLRQERDVPGMAPDLAERAGLGEDFVLTNAKLTSVAMPSTPPGADSSGSARRPSSAMYRITGLDNDKLQPLLNQRVEVTGRLLPSPRATEIAPPTVDPERQPEAEAQPQRGRAEDLPQIRASAIKAIAASCTAGTW
jgi:hypothetical protein